MTPATLRDTLLRAGRSVPVETFLHGRKPHEVAALRESMADLVEWDLAIDHGDTWQAVTGSGKAVATAKVVKVVKEGQRPLGVLPRMSERCAEGGKASSVSRRAALMARIDLLVERLRDGVPPAMLKGMGYKALWDLKKFHPEAHTRLMDAVEYGKRRGVAA